MLLCLLFISDNKQKIIIIIKNQDIKTELATHGHGGESNHMTTVKVATFQNVPNHAEVLKKLSDKFNGVTFELDGEVRAC